MVINAIMIGGQVMIIFVGGVAFGVKRLDGPQWGISIVLGFLSLPVGVLIRLIPDHYLAQILPRAWQVSLAPETLTAEQLEDGPHNLAFINRIKGGRIRHVRRKIGGKARKAVGMKPRTPTGLKEEKTVE
jgi:Ca2+-transporting ATPase